MRVVRGWRTASAAVLVLAAASVPIAGAQPQLPALEGPVNDFADVVDRASATRLETVIRTLQSRTGDAIVVVTVPTVAPHADARAYAVELFENRGRGIGARGQDNGLLVLLAVKERRVEIEVGYGLEPYITDGFAGETARQAMAPHFRRGEYGAGLLAGVERLAARIAEARGVTLEGVPQVDEGRRGPPPIAGLSVFALIVAFSIVRWIASGLMGPRRRSRWGRRRTWSGWHSGVGPFGGGFGMGGGFGGGFGGFGRGGGGGGFGGFGGGRSGGGGGGASW